MRLLSSVPHFSPEGRQTVSIEIDFIQAGKESKSGQAVALRFGDLSGPRDGQTVVIVDGGFVETGQQLVEHVKRYYDTDTVDLVVSTHPDTDHINGLAPVLMGLDVAGLWMHTPWDHEPASVAGLFEAGRQVSAKVAEGVKRSIDAAENLWTVADARGVPVYEPFAPASAFDGQLCVLGPTREFYAGLLPEEAEMTAFRELLFKATRAAKTLAEAAAAPIVKWVEESWDIETLTDGGDVTPINESSVVLEVRHEGSRVLLTADAGPRGLSVAADNVDSYGFAATGGYDLVQIPHHGSRHNVGPTGLNRLCGEIGVRELGSWEALACTSVKADEKHPAKVVTNAFARRGAKCTTTKRSSLRWNRNAPPRPDWNGPVEWEPFHTSVEADE
jgi:beta-lactamase superfamily II metal-dependent hydrolase